MKNKKSNAVLPKTTKKGITVRFTSEEYNDISKKAKEKYYSSINEYIRDCCFNKTTILENYSSKQEICKAFDDVRKEMLNTEKKLDEYMLYCVDSKETRAHYEMMIDEIKNDRLRIENLLKEILFKNFTKEKEIRELEENNHRKI